MIYLDHQSTTPCDPRVVEAMLPWFTRQFGNPHSDSHEAGRIASEAVERARIQVAELIGALPREIIFTSGATESNNLAIKGAARFLAMRNSPKRRLVTIATEHKCVLESVRDLGREGFDPVFLGVDSQGRVNLDSLRRALEVPTALVSVMSVNNETGVIQDIPGIAALTHGAGALFHTDAAQAVGKMPLSVAHVDLLSLSGHKIYGPKGIGALYVRHRPRTRLAPLFSGGGQERGLRSGTLPAPLVIGLGEACALALQEGAAEADRLAVLRDQLLIGLKTRLPGLVVNGALAPRVSGALNLLLPEGLVVQDMIAAMPDVAVSTGSACTSTDIVPSYVLTAMGLHAKEAARCLRLSVGRFTSTAGIVQALDAFEQVARKVFCAG